MPTVSVIVPVYKVEPYLHRCVDSILAQTFTDFELILVDDGSPDNCGAICDEYAGKDSRVRVIHQENGGLSAARNAGIDWAFANSDSQWLTFIDSDDWVHCQYLELLYNAAVESGAGVSACKYAEEREYQPELRVNICNSRICTFEELFCAKQKGISAIIACAKLYKKCYFKQIRYPIGKIHEDLFTTHKLLAESNCIVLIDAVLYFYYLSDSSITRNTWTKRRLDEVEASDELIRFLQERNLIEAKREAIRKRFWLTHNQIVAMEKLEHIDDKSSYRLLLRERRKAIWKSRELFPFKEEKWAYELAFPKLMWCYWTAVGVVEKIKKVLKRGSR